MMFSFNKQDLHVSVQGDEGGFPGVHLNDTGIIKRVRNGV